MLLLIHIFGYGYLYINLYEVNCVFFDVNSIWLSGSSCNSLQKNCDSRMKKTNSIIIVDIISVVCPDRKEIS